VQLQLVANDDRGPVVDVPLEYVLSTSTVAVWEPGHRPHDADAEVLSTRDLLVRMAEVRRRGGGPGTHAQGD
jgi:hypothetical protein